MSQIDSVPGPLTASEQAVLVNVADKVVAMAQKEAWRRPKMTTLVEEFAEAVLASRGKHDDPLHLELMQIASVCINLLWQSEMYGDEEIANLRTRLPIRENQEPVNT